MQVEFNASADAVNEFLQKAAHDEKFRRDLTDLPPDGLAELLRGFEVVVDPADVPEPPRTIPTREQCQQLIGMFGLNDPFARALYTGSDTRLAALMLVEAHAMPLVVTVQDEVATAS